MSSPFAPAGMVGWCMCRAQANPAVISSRRRLVVGKNTGSLWLTAEAISVSQPQIFGSPDRVVSKAGYADCADAIMKLSPMTYGRAIALATT